VVTVSGLEVARYIARSDHCPYGGLTTWTDVIPPHPFLVAVKRPNSSSEQPAAAPWDQVQNQKIADAVGRNLCMPSACGRAYPPPLLLALDAKAIDVQRGFGRNYLTDFPWSAIANTETRGNELLTAVLVPRDIRHGLVSSF